MSPKVQKIEVSVSPSLGPIVAIPIDCIFLFVVPLQGKQIGWTQLKGFIPDTHFFA